MGLERDSRCKRRSWKRRPAALGPQNMPSIVLEASCRRFRNYTKTDICQKRMSTEIVRPTNLKNTYSEPDESGTGGYYIMSLSCTYIRSGRIAGFIELCPVNWTKLWEQPRRILTWVPHVRIWVRFLVLTRRIIRYSDLGWGCILLLFEALLNWMYNLRHTPFN